MELAVLSAGAAQGLVGALREAFRAATGADVRGTFGAVGAIRAKLDAGERCDAIILTAALIAALEGDGRIVAGASAALGRVRTGVAVRAGQALPDVGDARALRAALLGASGIYIPDPELATAGIHFVEVLDRLGIRAEVAARLRPHPNGAAAMAALAASREPAPIGCTQVTEIRYTAGVVLVGPLPAGFELATVYTAAVSATARDAALARRFVALLADPAQRALRERSGFE